MKIGSIFQSFILLTFFISSGVKFNSIPKTWTSFGLLSLASIYFKNTCFKYSEFNSNSFGVVGDKDPDPSELRCSVLVGIDVIELLCIRKLDVGGDVDIENKGGAVGVP